MGLVKSSEPQGKWLPVSINKLDVLLGKAIYAGRGYTHAYALRRNIAYSLQHLEFLDRCLVDLKLTQVVMTQTWKTMIVVGCGIIESLLHFYLIARGLHNETEWQKIDTLPGNPKKLDGEWRRIDSLVYAKLDEKVLDLMTFDAMIKRARKRRVLGDNPQLYRDLARVRPLRNRVHLQSIDDYTDTDWNAFSWPDVCCIARAFREVFTSAVFRPSNEEVSYFSYLDRYSAT